MALELELKLCGSPAALRSLLKGPLLPTIALGPLRRQNLLSTYYDSPALELTRAGGALRLRKHGRRWLQTLKLRGSGGAGLSAREEIELPAPAAALDLVALQAALATSSSLVLPALVQPLFTTRFARTTLEVRLPGGGRAELAFDIGTIDAGEQSEALSEIEIELLEGAPFEVFALGRQLLAETELRVGNRSKAERGFALLAPLPAAAQYASAVELDGADAAQLGAARLLGEALGQLEGNEAGLMQGGDPEFIHQARVAMRRLRALLRLFAPLLADGTLDSLKAELRTVAQGLGRCRDLDVLCAETLPRLQAGLVAESAPTLLPLIEAALAARVEARSAARSELQKRAYTDLKLGLGELIARLADRSQWPSETTSLAEFASARLQRASRRLQGARDVREAVPAEAAVERVAATHALRIEVKKLRYACEALGPIFPGRRTRRYQRRLQRLQSLLGSFNDAATAQGMAAELLPCSAATASVQGYAAARMLELMEQLPAELGRFDRSRIFW
ncbi:MAG: CHAD domain-containing protein [Aquimonas sp.]|nr:CHAD domain-containing protein [Aquimonas sp.]